MTERRGVPLAELTTLRIGGPARRLVEARDDEELVAAIAAADTAREPLLVIAGGSNLVVADAGFPGTVVRVATGGVTREASASRVRLAISAGEPWDDVAAWAAAEGLAGIECLAGIPGTAGATPIQNVGAYGQEVADVIVSVRAYDRAKRALVELAPADCRFGYRTSALREGARHVVLGVTVELERSPLSRPLRYAELARALGLAPGDQAPLGDVRDAVLALRRGKGMVIDPGDPDSVSAGSFFVNPVLSRGELERLARTAARLFGRDASSPPAWPQGGGAVKTSAAWLIERAGFGPGFGEGAVGISSKHTLALVNRGGASAADLMALARAIQGGVRERFGVTLRPEPTLVGVAL